MAERQPGVVGHSVTPTRPSMPEYDLWHNGQHYITCSGEDAARKLRSAWNSFRETDRKNLAIYDRKGRCMTWAEPTDLRSHRLRQIG